MSVYRVTQIIGASETNWEDAAEVAEPPRRASA
jgi:flavin-binding protein dodecin